ncbi:orotidine-5'-phosphate decarboxylase [Schlesneria sp. T3-172]|uniref:orotidine-5'-phosphate decarboxylase n=1 Tax=Schlesneria sphaerica TaxID=3373610 RepID=UPI0037C6F08A
MSFHYATRLHEAIKAKKTPALVGLDPRLNQLPPDVLAHARELHDDPVAVAASAFEEFCVRLIDVVAPLVPAVKPQAAFFEEWGPDGCLALARVIRYARTKGLIVIFDGKRGDIGTTAEAYARAYLAGADPQAAPWQADALTVNPYLGRDTLEPFVKVAAERGAGIYVLVKTSNPGSASFQDKITEDKTLFRHVAQVVEELALETNESGYGSIGAVVGATYPRELVELRAAMPHVPLLIPGYGSQGGAAADVAPAFDANGLGAVVNNSRGINFAFKASPYDEQYGAKQWEAAAEAATKKMIADLAAGTAAGKLL